MIQLGSCLGSVVTLLLLSAFSCLVLHHWPLCPVSYGDDLSTGHLYQQWNSSLVLRAMAQRRNWTGCIPNRYGYSTMFPDPLLERYRHLNIGYGVLRQGMPATEAMETGTFLHDYVCYRDVWHCRLGTMTCSLLMNLTSPTMLLRGNFHTPGVIRGSFALAFLCLGGSPHLHLSNLDSLTY